MKTVGIWIDHRKALVVTIDGGNESREVVTSELERHPGPEGSRRTGLAYGPQVKSMDRATEDRNQHLSNRFYRDIITRIGVPDQLLVIGPADAKIEFAHAVEANPSLRKVSMKVESADRMDDSQVAERLRKTTF